MSDEDLNTNVLPLKQKRRKQKPAAMPVDHDCNQHHGTVIRLQAGRLHDLATEAEAALVAAGAPFYSRGGEVVRPIVEEVAAFHGRKTKVARLRQVSVESMRDYLSRAARFEKYNGRSKKMIAVDPPHDLAKTILARDGDWQHFLPLIGVITSPTLRPDGSILCKPGYDPTTRLLLLAPPSLPPIPERPSKGQTLKAVALLDDLLSEFPFAKKDDAEEGNSPEEKAKKNVSRAVALSALMTPVLRRHASRADAHLYRTGSGQRQELHV
jgi:putative DNA primase/helicase